MRTITTDKAYILGLIVGGGSFSQDRRSFFIKLPYKQWGDVETNPQRAGLIATDILQVVKPLMRAEYGIDVSYSAGREWRIDCSGDTSELIEDLRSVNIEPTIELHKTADISMLIQSLVDTNMKKRFIAGIADTIGSMAPSHRRFSEDVQIISFEISGFNYKFICQLCNLLYEVGCSPDQILWQHPNMQSGTDPYYRQWKKGNKLRVTLDSFSTFGSLAFKSKSRASMENLARESSTYETESKCEDKRLSVTGVVSVHIDENYQGIPEEIRGGHYIHNKQFCAVLNCPHAPRKNLDELLSHAEKYISPFAVLYKDTAEDVDKILNSNPLLSGRTYTDCTINVRQIINAFNKGFQTALFRNNTITFSERREKGYPLNVMLDGIAYIISSETGNLNGKRPRGNRTEIIMQAIEKDRLLSFSCRIPDILTPIVISNGHVSAMVGPNNDETYKKLISFSDTSKYKMQVRPIDESDLR